MTIAGYETFVVASEGMMLDQIIWRRFRRPMEGVLEAALDLPANIALNSIGPILPVGAVVTIPIPSTAAPAADAVFDLWS